MSGAGSKTKKDKTQQQQQQQHSSEEERANEYKRLAKESWDKSWEILHNKQWKYEFGNLDDGIIYTQHLPHYGKITMMEGYVDASPEFVFRNSVLTLEESIRWNPTIVEVVTLQVVDDCTDVSYNVASDAAGGLVASRDFVTLRHWKSRDGIILSSGIAVLHPDMPPTKKRIRGENKSGGWIYKPVPDNPDRCIFGWIVNSDIKGWIPQYIVDQAVSGMLIKFLHHLRQHIDSIKPKQTIN